MRIVTWPRSRPEDVAVVLTLISDPTVPIQTVLAWWSIVDRHTPVSLER